MKRFIGETEVDLPATGVIVRQDGDRLSLHVNGERRTAVVVHQGSKSYISYQGQQYELDSKRPARKRAGAASTGELLAPMPGAIIDVRVAEGDRVAKGDRLVILEAMKTQQPFVAPFDGIVERVAVTVGDQVTERQVLVVVRASESSA